jgi:hypothetical protein
MLPSCADHSVRAAANQAALARLHAVRPQWSAVVKAAEALALPPRTLLHAGPAFRDPLTPSQPVLSSAVLCCLYEGWAQNEAEAQAMLLSGQVRLLPAQQFNAVTPLAAVISPSTALLEISDAAGAGGRCWALLGSGAGPQLRFGSRNPAIIERLRWRDTRLFTVLQAALQAAPIELFALAQRALAAGDDLHSSTTHATRALAAQLHDTLQGAEDVSAMLDATPLFFLPLWMGACHLMLTAASRDADPACSVVVALAGNGQDVGVRLAGAAQHWLRASAHVPRGAKMLQGTACPMLGDSGVIDAAGFGAQAWYNLSLQPQDFAAWLPAHTPQPQPWQLAAHPAFADVDVGRPIDAAAISDAQIAPRVSIAMLDINGVSGLLGRGVCQTDPSLFGAIPSHSLSINQAQVWAELNDAFERYEQALVSNDLDTLDRLFWHSPHTLRYGPSEHLYGIEAIQAFRQVRPAVGLERTILQRAVTSFGNDFAVTHMVFQRPSQPHPGRQTQSWVRLNGQWQIVAAHVSWSSP